MYPIKKLTIFCGNPWFFKYANPTVVKALHSSSAMLRRVVTSTWSAEMDREYGAKSTTGIILQSLHKAKKGDSCIINFFSFVINYFNIHIYITFLHCNRKCNLCFYSTFRILLYPLPQPKTGT